MSIGNGWLGTENELMNYLRVVGADKDDEGRFLIYGEPVSSFMGMDEEFLVPAGTEYSVGGRRCNLAAGLSSTSGGLGVTVIS